MVDRLLQDALFFFTTLDPIGTLALFAALTARLAPAERRRTAHRAVAYATLILLAAIVIGQVLLNAMGVRLLSLQVAGGVILFLLGIQMLFSGSDQTSIGTPEEGHDLAVFPLAIPSLAGPGAIMASIVRTDSNLHSIEAQLATTGVLLGMMAVTWGCLMLAGPILRVIGNTGATILVRVMGMLLAALSAELILTALSVPGWAGS